MVKQSKCSQQWKVKTVFSESESGNCESAQDNAAQIFQSDLHCSHHTTLLSKINQQIVHASCSK